MQIKDIVCVMRYIINPTERESMCSFFIILCEWCVLKHYFMWRKILKKKFRKLRKIKKEGKNKDFILKLSLLYEKIESLIEIP